MSEIRSMKSNEPDALAALWGYASAVAYLLALVARAIGGC